MYSSSEERRASSPVVYSSEAVYPHRSLQFVVVGHQVVEKSSLLGTGQDSCGANCKSVHFSLYHGLAIYREVTFVIYREVTFVNVTPVAKNIK